MRENIENAKKLLSHIGHLSRQHDAYKNLDSIPVRHPVTGEDVELPITKAMKDDLKAKLTAKIQEVQDEIKTLSVSEAP